MSVADTAPPETTPAPPGPPPLLSLSRRQKAAIVVKWLIAEGADFSLQSLTTDEQLALTEAIADLRSIDKATLKSVAEEFASELDALAISFGGGARNALNLLDGRISDDTARAFRTRNALNDRIDPWDRLRALEPEDLLPILEREGVEIGAVLLSKLPVKKAAALLGLVPGDQARRITYAVSQTSGITPQAVARIGEALARQLDDIPPRAFSGEPVDRIGAILNSSQAITREDVLGGLTEEDEVFATQVRRTIFTFADIADRLEAKDIPAILREVDNDTLVIALTFAKTTDGKEAASADFLLDNISQRMAGQLRDQIEEVGKIAPADGEAAMTDVVDAIRALAAGGEITLLEEEDADT
ncbi:flagellar motor switch protein FliG [Aestuariibius sp. 2305UL40-4]|uniref:flagellar motor switch protein FliG n=1 Tax=Aestuariibius violaceus TaxID=3234132 RepID=UPI00345E5F95